MSKCISCSAADTNSWNASMPGDPVELHEIFDDIYYCYECAVKYNLADRIKPRATYSIADPDSWGTFNAAHK